MSNFANKELLNEHKQVCSIHKLAQTRLPEVYNNELSFSNWNHSLKVPFVVYTDFVCILRKVNTCQPPELDVNMTDKPYTNQYQKHEPISVCYYTTYENEVYKPPVEYFGKDTAKVFYESLKEESKKIAKTYLNPVPMIPLNENEMYKFLESSNCHICVKPIAEIPSMLLKKVKLYVKAINYFKDLGDEENFKEYKTKLNHLKKIR